MDIPNSKAKVGTNKPKPKIPPKKKAGNPKVVAKTQTNVTHEKTKTSSVAPTPTTEKPVSEKPVSEENTSPASEKHTSSSSTLESIHFINHPEFDSKWVEVTGNKIAWKQWGYAITEIVFSDKIWKIDVKFSEIPGIAWFGIYGCPEDEMGNVYDRNQLCVYQSNGFCGQSGFAYGNSPWKVDDIVSLEVNLTPKPSQPLSIASSPTPASSELPTSLSLSSTSTSNSTQTQTPAQSTSSSSTSSTSSSASSPSATTETLPEEKRTGHTLHFYVNNVLQPVSYVNIPIPLRFALYCNFGDSGCEVVDANCLKENYYLNSHDGKKVETAAIYDPDDRKLVGRVVGWNMLDKRIDR